MSKPLAIKDLEGVLVKTVLASESGYKRLTMFNRPTLGIPLVYTITVDGEAVNTVTDITDAIAIYNSF